METKQSSTHTFPKDFLFGTATAATQIEGGIVQSSWDRWSTTPQKIKDGTSTRRACDHWNRIPQDTALQQSMGLQTYRLGLDWARIEPQEGVWDPVAMDVYREEIEGLCDAGIKPLVTLHHFSNPLWVEEDDGWVNPLVIKRFVRFVSHCVEKLGDIVSDWVTINEPNIYLVKGYREGAWPPGHKDRTDLLFTAARHFARAHVQAYKIIHGIRRTRDWPGTTMVGAAHHLRVFEGNGGLLAGASAWLHERLFQGIFLEAMTVGKFILPLGVGEPWGKGNFCDFIGINYYSRDMVRGKLLAPPVFGETYTAPGSPRNDLNWEIYPQGLGQILRKLHKRYKLPLWITENGTADAKDAFRTSFLEDHLAQVSDVIAEGVPVQRYYHWSLMDNFEWAEGESARFGLIALNYETQERTLRPSAHRYSEIIKNRCL